MTNTPTVTVLMGVYNGERYVREALQSILDQTYTDFEFLIVDDGSTDNTPEILEQYAQKDARIRIATNQKNQGIIKSMNLGLEIAKGTYIARFDSDDISLPSRLQTQVDYMQTHPEVGVVGSECHLIDAQGTDVDTWKAPLSHTECCWTAIFRSPFINSSTLMRHECIIKHKLSYKNFQWGAEDYAFWWDFLNVAKGVNLPQRLVKIRKHGNNITIQKREQHIQSCNRVMLRHIKQLLPGRSFTEDQLTTIRRIHRCLNKPIQTQDFAAAHIILDLFQSALNNWNNAQDDLLKLRHRFIKLSMRACGIRHISTLIRSGLAMRMLKTDWRAALSFFS